MPVLPVQPYGITRASPPIRAARRCGSRPSLRSSPTCSTRWPVRASADPDRQRPRREHAGPGVGSRSGARSIPRRGVRYHDWWNSPRVLDVVARSTRGTHASWMENFPGRGCPASSFRASAKPSADRRPRPGRVPAASRRRLLRRRLRALRRGHAPRLAGRRRGGARAARDRLGRLVQRQVDERDARPSRRRAGRRRRRGRARRACCSSSSGELSRQVRRIGAPLAHAITASSAIATNSSAR